MTKIALMRTTAALLELAELNFQESQRQLTATAASRARYAAAKRCLEELEWLARQLLELGH